MKQLGEFEVISIFFLGDKHVYFFWGDNHDRYLFESWETLKTLHSLNEMHLLCLEP